jgi:hypothetical protein
MSTAADQIAKADDDVLARLNAAEQRVEPPDTAKKLERVEDVIAASTAKQENEARTVITWVVMAVYCGGLLLSAGLLVRLALAPSSSATDAKDAINQSLELMKVAILPVVTLVIGYYIGQRRSGNSS